MARSLAGNFLNGAGVGQEGTLTIVAAASNGDSDLIIGSVVTATVSSAGAYSFSLINGIYTVVWYSKDRKSSRALGTITIEDGVGTLDLLALLEV